MRTGLVVLLLTCCCSIAVAQYTIKVQVRDASANTALAGATVSINTIKLAADSAGNATHRVTATKVSITVSYTGYAGYAVTFPSRDTFLVVNLEPKADEGEAVVIVASSRTNSRIEDLPTRVEVLGAEEVNEENQIKPGNIASLLGDIAGVQIQQTNAATGNADMRIQGLPGKYTQVLRDGMPLFGGYSGSFGILQVPPLDLQQIELVKGAASTLYGGGAIAGMVNLVSKKPKLDHAEKSFTINRSTLKENNLNMFFSGRGKNTGYTLFAGGTLQDECDVNKDGFSDVPFVRSVFVHPRLFVYGKNNSSLALGYTFNYEERKGGDMQVLDNKADATHRFFIGNKTARNTADLIYETRLKNDAIVTAKGSTAFSTRSISTNVFGMKASQLLWYSELAYAKKAAGHDYVFGLNFNGETFHKKQPDSSHLPDEASHTLGLFVQADWRLGKQLTLQAGMRADMDLDSNVFLLPRISLMYKPSGHLTMRLGGGSGYKAVSQLNSDIDERYYRDLLVQNNLRPEKSFGLNYDINYGVKTGDWRLTFNETFFVTSIQHPVELVYPGITGTYFYQNEAMPLQTMGAETYVQAMHDELELYLGYVFTDSRRKYDALNPHFPLVSRHKFASVIAYEFGEHFRAGIESAFNGSQYRDDGSKTPSYLFLAAMVRYSVGKISIVLNGENLLDYRQSKKEPVVFPPYTNPRFPEIWAPLDGRVINLSLQVKW